MTSSDRKNLFTSNSHAEKEEFLETILNGKEFQLERIISTGQVTPKGEWLDQDRHEWVVLLTGSAGLQFEDTPEEITLQPGDWLLITANRRHRVEWTDESHPSVWLAIHYSD